MLTSSQQVGGYWLTSYTGAARFQCPGLERNTLVTSVMIDVLDPVASQAVTFGTVMIDVLDPVASQAVTFGKARSFAAGFALFTMADVVLVIRAARGTVPRVLVLVAAHPERASGSRASGLIRSEPTGSLNESPSGRNTFPKHSGLLMEVRVGAASCLGGAVDVYLYLPAWN
jgi:hypothetical protein